MHEAQAASSPPDDKDLKMDYASAILTTQDSYKIEKYPHHGSSMHASRGTLE